MAVGRVLIMAAGTGGHVFPALAIARQLEARGVQIEWLGTPQGLENRLLEDSGIPLHRIAAKGLKGKGIRQLLSAPWMLLQSLWQSIVIMRRVQPDAVLGMGGYVSGPGGLAAKLCGKRLYLHEQNAVAGLSNRLLARVADEVLEAFPGAFPRGVRTQHVGNPVRAQIESLGAVQAMPIPDGRPLRLLVLGGSQGARALNEAVPAALAQLRDEAPEALPSSRHQTGPGQHADTLEAYGALGLVPVQAPGETAEPMPRQQPGAEHAVCAFIDDMADAYAWADVVVCRSGASTVSELAAAGKPSILVPYPYHKDQQQLHNARWLEASGAAIILPQETLTAASLAVLLRDFSEQRARVAVMAAAARECAPRQVDAAIADLIMDNANDD